MRLAPAFSPSLTSSHNSSHNSSHSSSQILNVSQLSRPASATKGRHLRPNGVLLVMLDVCQSPRWGLGRLPAGNTTSHNFSSHNFSPHSPPRSFYRLRLATTDQGYRASVPPHPTQPQPLSQPLSSQHALSQLSCAPREWSHKQHGVPRCSMQYPVHAARWRPLIVLLRAIPCPSFRSWQFVQCCCCCYWCRRSTCFTRS